MSRARPLKVKDSPVLWVDTKSNSKPASEDQLELLATTENVDIDDLLDEGLTQGDVVLRVREAIGDTIPAGVLEAQEKRREERKEAEKCRLCGKEGDSTRHHFINKWILRELSEYHSKWSDRRDNCIPVCIHCHRELHLRNDEDKSIVKYLEPREKQYVLEALDNLADQRPRLVLLLARGDASVYESQLVKDWINGKFDKE